jgi:trehalose 6-phosphate synthase
MRASFRLIVSLLAGVTLAAFLFVFYQVQLEKAVLRSDLERHTEVLAESLSQSVAPLLNKGSQEDLQQLVEQFALREQLAGVAVYSGRESPATLATGAAARLTSVPYAVTQAIAHHERRGDFFVLGQLSMYIYVLPLGNGQATVAALAVLRDSGYIEAQSTQLWRKSLQRVLVQTYLIALISVLIIRIGIIRPIAKTAQWMRELRTGGVLQGANLPEEDLFKPLVQEVKYFAKSLEAARAAAQEEARLRGAAESLWTAERLRVHVRNKLQGNPLIVVSNREPLMHVHEGKSVKAIVPASGLVTAIEPVLLACGGLWVAHGAGDADRETADGHGRLRVPPEDPQYTLRRIWLSKEQEEGYYYGFSNEGLWPLCHIAHTRPTFRKKDWEHYQEVNQKFAEAVLEEMAGTQEPALLIQDYHFALLPRLVKKRRADARVAIFWHIPWPNPEAFGICPWEQELLDGLLGADLVGFHIQFHCNNFLETVDHALECRIEWERFVVNRSDHFTLVRPFPISVAFSPNESSSAGHSKSLYLARAALFEQLGIQATFLGAGVDRVDYTKGILERFRGLERFFEKYPAYQRRFTFVQIGAPSRTYIKRYHDLLGEVEAEAARINKRFETPMWKPIVLLRSHHSHREIEALYRMSDLCMVTSLHDGMNLVAKEFVASRDDEQGALILSRFTGASRELRDALVVNPYDIEELADAIRLALEMDPEERGAKMRRMRRVVKENNSYRWAASLITDLSEIHLEKPGPKEGS